MNKFPYWLKVTIRIILLPSALLLHLVPHIIALVTNLFRWVKYGGEFIAYTQSDQASMAKIFMELKKRDEQSSAL